MQTVLPLLHGIPPALLPVVTILVAAVIGAVLWRLFKLALKIVVLVVLLLVVVGVLVWYWPSARATVDAMTDAPAPPSPTQSEGARRGP